jgi:exodeoxyribonuclease VIII
MLDLETLGNTPGSVIASIGAVKFGEGKILDNFYTTINMKSCVKIGMTIDVSTIIWWMKQSDAARLEMIKSEEGIVDALLNFADWIGDSECEMWGNGVGFDNTLLTCAYDLIDCPRPWKYSNDRCYRTVKALLDPTTKIERTGTYHNALDDAISQANHLMNILKI